MLPRHIDITAITGQRIKGRPTAWQTPNGPFNVEHLGVRSPAGDVLVFFWSPQHDWQVVNVSRITGRRVASDLVSWQTRDGPFNVEHLAGTSPEGDLLVFFWSPRHDWQVVDVSKIAGRRIVGPVTNWQTPDGPFIVEHLAGRSSSGALLVFFWSPRHDWQVVDVTAKTGVSVASEIASWVTGSGTRQIEHLAARDSKGALHAFSWTPAQDWRSTNVSAIAGRDVVGSPTAWVTGIAEHLGVEGRGGALLVFWWTPATNWHVVDVSAITGQRIKGGLASYQLADGSANVELLTARSPEGALILFWWKPDRDWQSMSLTEAVGRRDFAADPVAWTTPNIVEHWAAQGPGGALLLAWGDAQPRRLVDRLTGPFQELQRTRNVRRKLLVILWDPHRPTDPAPTKAAVKALLFGATGSVRHYFLENSNGYFTIENAGVLGWYAADKPADHYWGPQDTNDSNGDGWVNPHIEKWAEAIRKAGADFDFAPFDANPLDGALKPSELGILIVIPQNSPAGFNRGALAADHPVPKPLVVDGVPFGMIAEAYIGKPPHLGLVAHELDHLFLGGPDMYFQSDPNNAACPVFPPQPYRAGQYSLMDSHWRGTHIDPFAKLKYGWLRPQLVLRSGEYVLTDVETRYVVRILMDPRRTATEYFIVENRWPGTSFDRGMSDTGGLAVWHIMENPAVYGSVPPPPGVSAACWMSIGAHEWGRRGIRLLRPVANPANLDNPALWDGASPATGYDLLSQDPDKRHTMLRWADGSPSGFAIRNIPPASAAMKVTIDVPF